MTDHSTYPYTDEDFLIDEEGYEDSPSLSVQDQYNERFLSYKNSNILTNIIMVTPEAAAVFLETNTKKNRRVVQSNVHKFSRDMADGTWRLSTDAIAFDTNGELINGQNRLHAVVKSGMTVPFLVMRNVPVETFDVLDQGAKRTFANVLEGMGVVQANGVGATVKQVLSWEKTGTPGRGGSTQRHSTAEMKERYLAEPEAFDTVVRKVAKLCGSKSHPGGYNLWGACGYFFYKASPEDFDWWVDALVHGVDPITKDTLPADHPVRVFREMLVKSAVNPKSSSWDPGSMDAFGRTVKCWNAYRSGKMVNPRSGITYRTSGPRAEAFPEVQ